MYMKKWIWSKANTRYTQSRTKATYTICIGNVNLCVFTFVIFKFQFFYFLWTLGRLALGLNNLPPKAKCTLELLTKKTADVPEWTSYRFDLNLLENVCQVLKMNPQHLDRP